MFTINDRVYEVAVIADDHSVQVTLFCDLVPVGEIIVDAMTGECDVLDLEGIAASRVCQFPE